MKNPYPELNAFFENYNAIINIAQSKAIFVRAIEIQKEQIEILESLLKKITEEKHTAQKEGNNEKSNLLLCIGLSVGAVINELTLITKLKEDKPDEAWDALIIAQNSISSAIRNHPFNGDYLEKYAYKLYSYEKLLFPEMYFASRGCTVSKSKCSICGEKLEHCEHMKGYAYMGELCYEIIEEFESLDEVSLVKNPADKRCRIIGFPEDGKTYDIFTHREIKEKK
ncbi:hypothetical protein [Prolixibacter denitrificans]|uniref:Uncharacterized protein n=1 Tax=Prolixibacter denitrificans TaxID=1541063 RepID=A0A2P8C6L3_9BACT|nr:hypothetical protein [Prolixibacter denitrificans]PSK80567.1 hypothetical protein CLV93_1144 [Prolixibacter denitrificans]GET22137.1 hypothetical protein JCM18694_23830 [Prolixibacter denitrificans]